MFIAYEYAADCRQTSEPIGSKLSHDDAHSLTWAIVNNK